MMSIRNRIIGRTIRGFSGGIFGLGILMPLYFIYFYDNNGWFYALCSLLLFPISYYLYKISQKFHDDF